MSDHEKLREAIKWASNPNRWGFDTPTCEDHLARLAVAAASTLPKTKTVEMKCWALIVNGAVVEVRKDDDWIVGKWRDGCVAMDSVIELTGFATVPS